MNKRLKELMMEAGFVAPELAPRAQLLATLIVDECATVLETESHQLIAAPTQEAAEVYKTAAALVKKHFGGE